MFQVLLKHLALSQKTMEIICEKLGPLDWPLFFLTIANSFHNFQFQVRHGYGE